MTNAPRHPTVVAHEQTRAADLQLRFVYLHAAAFAAWMLLIEPDPWPKLTLVVSLEAIFLSTFVLIGQNRQAVFQQAKANHDFVAQEQELGVNTELTRAIHTLATEIHRVVVQPAEPT
jgi:uncharacterized membrane protein